METKSLLFGLIVSVAATNLSKPVSAQEAEIAQMRQWHAALGILLLR